MVGSDNKYDSELLGVTVLCNNPTNKTDTFLPGNLSVVCTCVVCTCVVCTCVYMCCVYMCCVYMCCVYVCCVDVCCVYMRYAGKKCYLSITKGIPRYHVKLPTVRRIYITQNIRSHSVYNQACINTRLCKSIPSHIGTTPSVEMIWAVCTS